MRKPLVLDSSLPLPPPGPVRPVPLPVRAQRGPALRLQPDLRRPAARLRGQVQVAVRPGGAAGRGGDVRFPRRQGHSQVEDQGEDNHEVRACLKEFIEGGSYTFWVIYRIGLEKTPE